MPLHDFSASYEDLVVQLLHFMSRSIALTCTSFIVQPLPISPAFTACATLPVSPCRSPLSHLALACADASNLHGQVLTRALQLHPTEPRLWSHAAGFEFEDHHNPAAARLLLQRGLRICPNSIPLWLENFRLELLYAHQLRTRRKVLGLEPGALNHLLLLKL